MFAGGLIVSSLASALVYASTRADVAGSGGGDIWTRALERGWAVIVISFVQSIVIDSGMGGIIEGAIGSRILGVVLLLLGLTLIFADIDAVVNDEEPWWLLVPLAFSNSIRAAWSGRTMLRVIGLFVAQLVIQQAGYLAIAPLLQKLHVADAEFWATMPVNALLLAPFGILTVLVYFDAIGYESKRTCGG